MLINVDIMGSSIVQIRFPDEAACCRETLKTCGNQLIISIIIIMIIIIIIIIVVIN